MNKLILTAMVALFSFAAADSSFAQKTTPNKGGNKGANKEQRAEMSPEERATKATERMTKRYALDANQVTKVKAANLAFTTEMKAIRAKGKDGRAEVLPARDRHRAAIKAILNVEQNVKFEADLAEAKARHEARRAAKAATGGKGGAKPPKAGDGDIYEMLGGHDEDIPGHPQRHCCDGTTDHHTTFCDQTSGRWIPGDLRDRQLADPWRRHQY